MSLSPVNINLVVIKGSPWGQSMERGSVSSTFPLKPEVGATTYIQTIGLIRSEGCLLHFGAYTTDKTPPIPSVPTQTFHLSLGVAQWSPSLSVSFPGYAVRLCCQLIIQTNGLLTQNLNFTVFPFLFIRFVGRMRCDSEDGDQQPKSSYWTQQLFNYEANDSGRFVHST